MYKACDVIMQEMLKYDQYKDGLIENCGKPDQTFDTWVMTGARLVILFFDGQTSSNTHFYSAYCGGLWLGAVYAMTRMAASLGKTQDQNLYQKILSKGTATFNSKLWNGKYYNFDSSNNQSDSIMADQLNAHWYLNCIESGESNPVRFPAL